MTSRDWLLEDADYDIITGEKQFDFVRETLFLNGITSKNDAFDTFLYSRFEYSYPDCHLCGRVDSHWQIDKETWKCKWCRANFTITAGTYLENTKLEFYQWYRFSYLLGALNVTNSCLIAKDIEVTQKTSWGMLETVRKARKENTEKKFVNGQEVLVFNNLWEVITLLLIRKNQPTINFPTN